MNDVRLEGWTGTELRVLRGGAGLAARGVGKTYKKRPVVRNVTIELSSSAKEWLAERGYKIVALPAALVETDLTAALDQIEQAID